MDKIVVDQQDIERLLAWRDEHKEAVRSQPCPMKAIEIVCLHNGFRIKGFRDGDVLKLHLNQNGQSLGSTEFRLAGKMWAAVPGKNRMKTDSDGLQSVLTVYCSLMALIATARPKADRITEAVSNHTPIVKRPHSPRKPSGITYLILDDILPHQGRKHSTHASPKGEFSVRGHWRHYKSGKTVWVEGYRKGTGKKKQKEYRLRKSGDQH